MYQFNNLEKLYATQIEKLSREKLLSKLDTGVPLLQRAAQKNIEYFPFSLLFKGWAKGL